MDTNPKKQRQHFYRDYASGQWSMSELCARYRISRPTGYKWVDRIEAEGLKAVEDRSRAPNRHPNRTPEHVEREILVLREKYGWGATKLREILKRRHPRRPLPARSTINEILDRHGQLRKNRRRQSWKHPGAVRLETAGPNEIWPADFKGQFKMGDRKYCYPLTVTDHYSRMLLLCKALPSVRTEGAKPAFRSLFREYGLPDAIRTDNGAPFASTGIHGLCDLLAGVLDPTWLIFAEGVAAGAMLTMIASAMIPEAVHMGTANAVGLSTLAGFMAAISFKLLE